MGGGCFRGGRQFFLGKRRHRAHFSARADDAATATLLCALSPSLRFNLRAQTPLAGALDALFAGETCDVSGAFDAVENTVWAPELWRLARAGLEAVIESATTKALASPGLTK